MFYYPNGIYYNECKFHSFDEAKSMQSSIQSTTPQHHFDVMLAALRHLQQSIHEQVPLNYLSDIADLSLITSQQIDELCEGINNAQDETYRVVVLSTAHLTSQDNEWLSVQNTVTSDIIARPYGYLIKLPGDDVDDFMSEHSFSENLQKIIYWAINAGFGMIEFDCDAEVQSQLAVYEW